MNFVFEFFLAWRYLKPKRNAVSVISCISITGVALGVAVLIVVLAVMTGFTDIMKDKLLDTGSHMQIFSGRYTYIKNPEEVVKAVEAAGGHAAPIVNQAVLIQKEDRFVPKFLIGLDLDKAQNRIDIKDTIKYGNCSLNKSEVMISTEIARELNVFVGDKILLHSPSRLAKLVKTKTDGKGVELSKDAEVYLPEEYTVSGLFSFGKYDFDRNMIFIGLEDADELYGFPWGAATAVYAWVDDPFNMDKEIKLIKDKLPAYQIRTWQQINSRLLGVLAVEKNMMFYLLIFIVLVAAFSIMNTLITVTVQKTKEIGLLKALGAGPGTIMRVFLLQGFYVGIAGTFSGLILGSLVVHYRMPIMIFFSKLTGRELFPKEFYFFNELPAHMVGFDLTVICVSSIVLCTFGALIPAWRAARLDPASSLRYE